MREEPLNRSHWLIAASAVLGGIVLAAAIAAALAPVVLPMGDRLAVDGQSVAAGVIFVGGYLALAIAEFLA